MPTIRTEIGPKQIKEAISAANVRAYTSASPLIFADVVEKGLQLRVQASSVTWLLRWSGNTRSLGGLSEIANAKAAREIAAKVRRMLRDGIDPKPFLTGTAAGKSDDEATAAAARLAAVQSGQWIRENLVERYTEGYLANPRLSKGKIKQPSLASAKNAKLSLQIPEADILKGKLLSELSVGDLERVRDSASAAKRKTASRAFVANARAAFSYAKRKHAGNSGLADSKKWWLELEILDETAVGPRERMPSLEDIARTLYVAEKHRTLEGRKNRRGTSETVLCGLWWLALTAQRSSAGLSLEKAHVLPWPDGPEGWKIATWSEAVMKSRRVHALPIPPRAALLIERSIASNADNASRYVFPATARRFGGDDMPLSKTAPKNLIARLRGRPLKLRRAEGDVRKDLPDLLADVAHFSMHDLRRTFATYCGDHSVRGDAISAVLDHAGLETGQQMMRSAEVTRLAYDYSQRLELKSIAMEEWTNALFAAVDEEWKRHRPRLGFPAPTRREDGLKFNLFVPWYSTMESWPEQEQRAAAKAALIKRQTDGLTLKRLRLTTEADDWDDQAR